VGLNDNPFFPVYFLQPTAHCDCEIIVVHFSLWFIPDLSWLRNLEILDLSFNYLSSSFPSWVGSLTGLVQLGLGENNFDGGSASVSHSLTFFFFFFGWKWVFFFRRILGQGTDRFADLQLSFYPSFRIQRKNLSFFLFLFLF
jgi:hypothetical protein